MMMTTKVAIAHAEEIVVMIRLRSHADYLEHHRELVALEELTDASAHLVESAHHHANLRPELTVILECFGEAVIRALDAHLVEPLAVRRDALRLYEEMCAGIDQELNPQLPEVKLRRRR